MNLGEKIDYFIFQKGISQKILANDLNIATTTLNGYIKNKRQPSFETLVLIANYFDVSCDYLLDNENNSYSVKDISFLQKYKTLTTNQKELIDNQITIMINQNLK